MSTGTRLVILDGDSAAFEFTGTWRAEKDSYSGLGTLWTTTGTSGSSMVFQFNGKDFSCTWQGKERTDDGGPHTVRVDISIPVGSNGPSPSFSIDSLRYLPSPDSAPLSDPQGFVEYRSDDPHIDYASGDWKTLDNGGSIAKIATEAGSSATVMFTGTKVMWFAWTKITSNSSGDLSEGAHNLTLIYNNPSGNPLVLEDLWVKGGDFRIGERPTNYTRTPTFSFPDTDIESPTGSPSRSVSTGVIAGVVGGSLAVVTLALLACYFARRRRKKHAITLPNPSQVLHLLAGSPPSSATVTTGQISQSPSATVNSTSPPHSSGTNHQQPDNESTTLYHAGAGHDPPAGPSTALTTPTALQAHGVTTNQGDFTLAGRDVHLHKHYHWRHATEIDTHIPTAQPYGEAATNHFLQPHPEHLRLPSEPHASQQPLDRDGPVSIGDPRSSNRRLEEARHVYGTRQYPEDVVLSF
ncbi:hypothetical protein BKA70DRAFT_1532116 [Coprinopsis sp. MPI-PUGE-AT-0042]|nr:hypothetical protein BKA70DRAFT_1532116 [Coprinopsis sp. MPI-PUGE-AT-0042]